MELCLTEVSTRTCTSLDLILSCELSLSCVLLIEWHSTCISMDLCLTEVSTSTTAALCELVVPR